MKLMIGLWRAVALSVCCFTASAQDAPVPASEAEPAPVNRGIPRQNLFAHKYHFTPYEVEQYSERLELSAEQHELFVQMFSAMQERVMEAERPLREAEAAWLAFSEEVFRDEDSGWRDTPDQLAAGDLRNRSRGENGLWAHVKAQAILRGVWQKKIADLRVEYGLDEPEEASDD